MPEVLRRLIWLSKLVVVIAILVLIMAVLLASFTFLDFAQDDKGSIRDCYVGVAFCGNTTADAKLLIDRVKDYTNLFIVQSGPVSKNETSLNEICSYAVTSGLDLIVYFGDLSPRPLAEKHLEWRTAWVSDAKSRWGDRFLGVFYYDEPGGMWIDTDWSSLGNFSQRQLLANATYDWAAQSFIGGLQRDGGFVLLKNSSVPIIVSDYALYWFDYQAGYDILFAQIGWNNSLAQEIGLVRGAANMQNKQWGVMITWTYDNPPYLTDANKIYNQMVASYEAGAKYVTIFNYPQLSNNSYGVMTNEHFEALKQFWNDAVTHKIVHNSKTAQAALVLPSNYGWGMRSPVDRIWGFWGPDEKSSIIWSQSQSLLAQYGYALDIIYDDPKFPITEQYQKIYYWNSLTSLNG
jgi:hypothetical protein